MGDGVYTIRPEFSSHDLRDVGRARIDDVKAAFSTLLNVIEANIPPGRERSIATTHLQDACMWAARGIAIDPAVQRDPSPAAVLADEMRRGTARFGGPSPSNQGA